MQWFNLEDNINLLSLIGAIAIIVITLIIVGRMFAQMKVKKSNMELMEHDWDGIKEAKNNPPFGWLISFLILIIWMLWYFLSGYPLNSYSQIGEYNKEVNTHNKKFEQKFTKLSSEDKIKMGKNIFLVQCATCHGIDGVGIDGKAADLSIWGSEQGLIDVINKGSKGMNYPMGEMLGANDLGLSNDDAKAIAAYVSKDISSIKITKNENLVSKGKELFENCMVCHGENGANVIEGELQAPDLRIYGSADFVVEVLKKGKNGHIGHMPNFDINLLNEIQKQAVGEYVISLSKGDDNAK